LIREIEEFLVTPCDWGPYLSRMVCGTSTVASTFYALTKKTRFPQTMRKAGRHAIWNKLHSALLKHYGFFATTEVDLLESVILRVSDDTVLSHLIIIRLKRRRDRHYSLPIP